MWHLSPNKKLGKIDSSTTLEIVRNLEDSIPTFYVESTEMGIWKEKYVIQLKNFGINENIQVLKEIESGFLVNTPHTIKIVNYFYASYYLLINCTKYSMKMMRESNLSN